MINPDNRCRAARRVLVTLGAVGLFLTTAAPARAVVSQTPAATPTFNNTVLATAYVGNTIYVGGDFTAVYAGGKAHARAHLAAINATTGALLPWAPSADGQVRALVASGGAVYIAGQFGHVNGAKRDSLAKLDGRTGTVAGTFKHSILGKPYALAVGSGRLYLGGAITGVDGHARTRLAAFSLTTGALDAGWRPTADDQVEALVAGPGRVYVGGKFHHVNGAAGTDRLVAVSPTSGALDRTFHPRVTYITLGITVTATRVYAVHGGLGGRAVAYDLAGNAVWTLTTDGDAQAVTVLGDAVYVGGHFDNVCRSSRNGDHGVCLDGNIPRGKLVAASLSGAVLPWVANGNGITGVHTLASSAGLGKVAAGGAFTTINGVSQKRFAQFG